MSKMLFYDGLWVAFIVLGFCVTYAARNDKNPVGVILTVCLGWPMLGLIGYVAFRALAQAFNFLMS